MVHNLQSAQVESILRMLKRELSGHQIHPFERVCYHLLQAFIALSVLSLFLFLVIGLATGFSVTGPASHWLYRFFFVYVGSGLLSMGLFVVNLVYARRFRLRLKLLSEFGVLDVLGDPWSMEDRGRRSGQFFSSILLILGVSGTLLGALLLAVFLLYAASADFPRDDAFLIGMGVFVFMTTCFTLVGYYFLRIAHLRRRLLTEADRLRNVLETKLSAGEDEVVLEAATLRQLAAIERAQIRRSRKEAIQKTRAKSDLHAYQIIKSPGLVTQQAGLESEAQLAVEYAIQDLSAEDLARGHKEGVREHLVEKASAVLQYQVDEEARRIVVFGLRDRESTTGDGGAAGDEHA